ncbi:serine/threonine-protein phosphatase rdgC isoform X2 [Stomoxys calcitrans]|uniref:serine/threonine-protein phosphatase rdgC isoform X2 n=1 Tax=Stomoxys calcitrans TaxID=35570 RepID=UPI0027E387EF|nr:serine/threonine-protein phosphatase rdgC isoform X2 [Stomoxys calcitrans]
MEQQFKAMKAALLIQRWYRRHNARMEIKRRYTWSIFTNLEYAGEQDQVELYNFFNALLTHIPNAAADKNRSYASSTVSSLDQYDSKYSDESDYHEEYDNSGYRYKGPQINFPLTRKDIDVLIDLFRKKKSNRLHARYVGAILKEAALKLRTLPNLNTASTAISKQITICGDLHGKLDDLLVVFYKNGLPSSENPYVFNGDFVDRGKKGLEVFLLLLACFLAFPNGVFLNRGNHEDSVMNARYGFIREVQQKYRRNSTKLLRLIDEVYRWLPLGTVINSRVLVVHGGISDTTNLDLIKSLDRGKYVSILRPPVEQTGGEGIDKVEWKQLFDIMWSDPQHNDGCLPNSLRGAGTYFGPDVTRNFLEQHKLEYLVRSHECKVDGYEYLHDEKVITIFSASNYYAIGSNRGAYMKLNPHLEPHFVQYISAASKTRQLTFRQRVGIVESSAIRELGARLRARRNDLEEEFRKNDPKNTGYITISHWCDAMEKATNLGLPWRLLRPRLAPSLDERSSNEVNYLTTLDLLDTDTIIEAQAQETSVADSLYKNVSSLEAIFHILDSDQSGYISLSEFSDACDLLEQHLPGTNTREQLLDMCRMMDLNKDGLVDLNEFLEAFRLCEQAKNDQVAGRPPRINKSPSTETVSGNGDGGGGVGAGSGAEGEDKKSERRCSTSVAEAEAELKKLLPTGEDDDIDPKDCEANTLKRNK